VATRLADHVVAEGQVVELAVACRRPHELRLCARARDRDQLLVVAAEAHEAAVHGLVGAFGVQGRDVVLELAVVLLQPLTRVAEVVDLIAGGLWVA